LKIVVRNFVPREVIFPEDVSWMMAKKREGMPRGVSRGVMGYRHMDAKEGAFRNQGGGKMFFAGVEPRASACVVKMGIDEEGAEDVAI